MLENSPDDQLRTLDDQQVAKEARMILHALHEILSRRWKHNARGPALHRLLVTLMFAGTGIASCCCCAASRCTLSWARFCSKRSSSEGAGHEAQDRWRRRGAPGASSSRAPRGPRCRGARSSWSSRRRRVRASAPRSHNSCPSAPCASAPRSPHPCPPTCTVRAVRCFFLGMECDPDCMHR